MPRRPRRLDRSALLVLGGAVALVCFGAGFVLAYDDSALQLATGPTTTIPRPARTTTSVPTTVGATPSTEGSTLPATTSLPVDTAPTSLAPTVPSTRPPTTVASAPAHLKVTYPRNASGEMVLFEGSSSAVLILNDGGSPGTYVVQGVGFITVGTSGTASGTLGAGAVIRVPLVAGENIPHGTPAPQASVTVFDAGGPVLSFPVVITSRDHPVPGG